MKKLILIGINADFSQRLLQLLVRMDSARNKNEGCSGFAICNCIAKLHRSSLALINRPTGCLEARLTLPMQT